MIEFSNSIAIKTDTIQDRHKQSYHLRRASESDVVETTLLIRKAYGYWADQGLAVSPARQTEEQTREHLCDWGYVAIDSAGAIIATITLEEALVVDQQDQWGIRFSGAPDKLELPAKKQNTIIPGSGKYLVFKKFAVDPSLKRSGLGTCIYALAEEYATQNHYEGLLLETVIEARWLYDWYVGLGFNVIAGEVHPNSSIETLVLIKNLK